MAGQIDNPYFGLLLFVAVPAVLVFGLLLIPLGVWRQHRRGGSVEWPHIDGLFLQVFPTLPGHTIRHWYDTMDGGETAID